MPKPATTTRQRRSRAIEDAACKRAFLRAYVCCGSIARTTHVLHMDHQRHLRWLAKDPAYAEAFGEAAYAYRMGLLEICEKEIHRRAVEGIDVPIHYQGKRVDTIKKWSDVLLMFLTKQLDPSYRDSQQVNVATNVNVQQNQSNQIRVVEDGDWYGNADRLATASAAESTANPVVAG